MDNKKDVTPAIMGLIFGILLFFSSIFLLILNTYSSATGTVGLTGGAVAPAVKNIYLVWSVVTDGGKFGLIFGIVIGIIANSYQFMSVIIRDRALFRDNPTYMFWITTFDIISRGYDFVTAYWYTTQGHDYFPNGFTGELGDISWAIGQFIFHIIVVGFLTIGSEIFFALSLKLISQFGKDGILSIIDLVTSIYDVFIEIRIRIEELGEKQLSPTGQSSSKRSPEYTPRPPKPANNSPKPGRGQGRPPRNTNSENLSHFLGLGGENPGSDVVHNLDN